MWVVDQSNLLYRKIYPWLLTLLIKIFFGVSSSDVLTQIKNIHFIMSRYWISFNITNVKNYCYGSLAVLFWMSFISISPPYSRLFLIEISYFLIFPLHFSEFPLYILGAMCYGCVIDINKS